MEIYSETKETKTTYTGEIEGCKFWAEKTTLEGFDFLVEGISVHYAVRIYDKLKRSVKEKLKRKIVEHLIKIYG